MSSSNKTLTFKYEVQEGDSTADLDYASSTALNLNGGLCGCGSKAIEQVKGGQRKCRSSYVLFVIAVTT